MIDLEEIKRHRALWTPDDGTSLPTICEHVDALVAEVERLLLDKADIDHAYAFARNKAMMLERAAVVAWLQRMAGNARHWGSSADERAEIYDRLVDVFECGEHRREED